MYDFSEKKIAIIGGTGSLGRALLKSLLSLEKSPKKIVIFSRDEAKHHNIKTEYCYFENDLISKKFKEIVHFIIGDVRSYQSLMLALKDIDIVVHASALKQVPTCEYFPKEAIQTNIIGAYNLIHVAHILNTIECIIGISTDKACKPINAYGMTKAIMEKLFIAANIESKKTKFVLARYGNVIDTTGSVLPLFKKQVLNKQPITLTHPDMTRFFFKLDKAIETIYNTIIYANPGEIFIPIMNSFRIKDIADILAENNNLPVEIVGIRPSEKIHEDLISIEEGSRTYVKNNYYIIEPQLSELVKEEDKKNRFYINKPYSSKDCLLPKELVLSNILL